MVLVALPALLVGCGSPPQVVEISPQRGAVDVRSSEPVRIRFDRPMDQATVATRFHLSPKVEGALRWISDRELVYEHAPLQPSSRYEVVIDPGYRDAQGNVNALRHGWSFRTEQPPALTGASPGSDDQDVDPASYITLTFSRAMNLDTLRAAVSVSPTVQFSIRQDPADSRRVILAPESLLVPRVTYTVTATSDARDVDGNRLGAGGTVAFTTGDFRPLRHWIGFIAESSPGTGSDGVWIVADENRFPRRLATTPASSFSWSPDGSRLLLRSPTGTWLDQPLDGNPRQVAVHADWMGFLGPGLGYAFLDQGGLQILEPSGRVVPVAGGVTEAAVAPAGNRLAFVVANHPGPVMSSEIDGYDVDLRTRFLFQTEPATVDGLTWSADGMNLAYRTGTGDPARRQIRARLLRAGGSVTVATGEVSPPAWQADSRHVFFTAVVGSPDGPISKAFRLGVGDAPPRALTTAIGMPSAAGIGVDSISPSADGHQLAFLSDVGGRAAVWLMNADGTGLLQLTRYDDNAFPYFCRAVTWTPS